AGDLIEPRVDKATGINDAIVATGHWWLGDQTHSPVDVRKHQADRVDNQLDVVSKAFLGVTLACARCHDHKFDAISTEDYYALFGVVESSRYAQVPVRAASEADEALLQELEDVRARIVTKALDSFAARASEVPESLRAAELAQARASAAKAKREAEAAAQQKSSKDGAGSSAAKKPKPEEVAKLVEQDRAACIAGVAAENQLDSQELKAFVAALADRPGKLPAPTLARSPARIAQRAGDDVFADFTAASPESFAAWRQTGTAFGVQPTGRGVLSVDARGPRLRLRFSASDGASTAARSARAVGGLYSRSFVLDKRFLHIRARGRDSRINLVPEGFPLLRNPIWGHFKLHVTNEAPRWYRIDAQKQRGLRVAFEFLDQPVHDPADPFRRTYDERGYLHVEAIVLSDDGAPPRFAAAADNRTADATDAS
ncbi:MAG TPA: DUF1549 domain-containing protein, partial [Planctomycetota bacterium]|nr:DUF1549 domain-containing protein [Planctomycetota bacterium]